MLVPEGRANVVCETKRVAGRQNPESSTALRLHSPPPHKRSVRLAPARDALPRAKPLIGGLFKDLGQNCAEHANKFHPRSSASRVITNGVSVVAEALRPDNAPIHCRTDSISNSATMRISNPVTTASKRLLKMSRALPPAAASCRACARKPMRGSGSKILCHDAVNVTMTRKVSGTKVTARYVARRVLRMMVVAMHKAAVASS